MIRELLRTEVLKKHRVQAKDGVVGHIEDFYFDETDWLVQYLMVDTGNWLKSRRVLLPRRAVTSVDTKEALIAVDLTRDRIHASPPLEPEKPPSLKYRSEIERHYPRPPAVANKPAPEEMSHLLSMEQVGGYHVQAMDGELGHVVDFIVDDQEWKVCYLEIDTRNWWPGKKVLIAQPWIENFDWQKEKVHVDLPRHLIRTAPAYDPAELITRDYEVLLYGHYGRRL